MAEKFSTGYILFNFFYKYIDFIRFIVCGCVSDCLCGFSVILGLDHCFLCPCFFFHITYLLPRCFIMLRHFNRKVFRFPGCKVSLCFSEISIAYWPFASMYVAGSVVLCVLGCVCLLWVCWRFACGSVLFTLRTSRSLLGLAAEINSLYLTLANIYSSWDTYPSWNT